MPLNPDGPCLAFDPGRARTGVAVGSRLSGGARPLTTIAPDDLAGLKRLVNEWRPATLLVGLPLDEDGKDQPMTLRARSFAAILGAAFPALAVHLVDERHTSRAALADLREARAGGALNRRTRPGDRDTMAACLILEQWLGEGDSKNQSDL